MQKIGEEKARFLVVILNRAGNLDLGCHVHYYALPAMHYLQECNV